MNKSPVHSFCESPHRKLIVIIATTLFGLVVLIPLVDDYFNKKESHRVLNEDLDRVRLTAEALPTLKKQVAEVTSKLAAFESRAVTDGTISRYRNKMVDLVREVDCQVRRFDVGTPSKRAWSKNDNPLAGPTKKAKKEKTPFTLERRSVVLLVDGTIENLQKLLERVHQDDALAYLNRINLKPSSLDGEEGTLELEVWLFALGRQRA